MKTIQRIAAHFGFAFIPLEEIKRMELDAASDYKRYTELTDERDKGYFNGLADATAKRAFIFAEKYVPFSAHWKCRAPFGVGTWNGGVTTSR